MKTIFDFTSEELNTADRFIFAIYRSKESTNSKFLSIETKKKKFPDIDQRIIKTLNEGYWFTMNSRTGYTLTEKTERVIELYGGFSIYVENQQFQNESLKLTRKALIQNKIALWVSAGSLVAFVAFQIWNLLQC